MKTMKKIGFIDIDSKWGGRAEDLLIHIFRDHPGGFELERTVQYTPAMSSELKQSDISDYYLSLPLDLLNFRVLSVPFQDREKLRKILPFELDSLIIGGSSGVAFDAIPLDSGDMLVAYADKKKLTPILTTLSSLNLDPRVVTSIELRAVLNKGLNEIIPRLLNFTELTVAERIKAATDELLSNSINLRTGSIAYTKDTEKIKKTLRLTATLAILLSIVINAYLFFSLITSNKNAAAMKREVRSVFTALFPDDKKITDELYQTKSHIKDIQSKLDALEGVYPLRLMAGLSQVPLHGIVFNEISLEKDITTIKGEAVSMESITGMKAPLSKVMNNVTVSEIKPSSDGKLIFTAVVKK